jgi:hypothetical protein
LAEIGRWLSFTRLGQLGEAVNRHDFARPETVLSEKAFTRKPLKRAARALAILMASTLQGARTRKTLRDERGYWHSDGSGSCDGQLLTVYSGYSQGLVLPTSSWQHRARR